MKNKKTIISSILFLLFAFSAFALSGCAKKTSMILFNQYPITKENLLSNSSEFIQGKRFYYIFVTERPLDSSMIRVRILKREEKANFTASKLVYSNDFKPSRNQIQEQIYYYTDYLVLEETGYYCMQIYSTDLLNSPLAVADFKIKAN